MKKLGKVLAIAVGILALFALVTISQAQNCPPGYPVYCPQTGKCCPEGQICCGTGCAPANRRACGCNEGGVGFNCPLGDLCCGTFAGLRSCCPPTHPYACVKPDGSAHGSEAVCGKTLESLQDCISSGGVYVPCY
jgi:hypothetical protein